MSANNQWIESCTVLSQFIKENHGYYCSSDFNSYTEVIINSPFLRTISFYLSFMLSKLLEGEGGEGTSTSPVDKSRAVAYMQNKEKFSVCVCVCMCVCVCVLQELVTAI